MRKNTVKWTCDACLVSRVEEPENWMAPVNWAEVTVNIGGGGTETIHFCQPCWETGNAPVKNEQLPALIRRFFGWVVQK